MIGRLVSLEAEFHLSTVTGAGFREASAQKERGREGSCEWEYKSCGRPLNRRLQVHRGCARSILRRIKNNRGGGEDSHPT